jgi:hemolysin activation/secretion protein
MNKLKPISALILALICSGVMAQEKNWTITGAKEVSEQVFQEISKKDSHKEITDYIYKTYQEAGFPVVNITVDVASKTIKIEEPAVDVSGKYSKYFKNGVALNKTDLELSILRMKTESNMNGDKVTVDIGAVKEGKIPVVVSETPMPEYKKYDGLMVFNTLGQRYSGPDVLTAYGFYNLGDGQQIEGSLSHGFQWRDEAKGGRFENLGAGYKKAHEYGLTSLNYSYTNYKVGGEYADLDLNGEINALTLKNEYLFNKNFVGSLAITHKTNKQELGIIDIWEKQNYTYLTVGGMFVNQVGNLSYSVNGELEKGLGGSTNYNAVPIMGVFDPEFSSVKANLDLSYKFENDMSLQTKIGFQKSSDETPSANSFFLGGPDRGRAYTTGFASMPEGMYFSNQLNFKDVKFEKFAVAPYIGYEYAQGKQSTGEVIKAESVFIGAQIKPDNKKYNFNVVFAQELNPSDTVKVPTNRLNVILSMKF